ISIRVLEPGHPVTVRRCPHSELILLHEGKVELLEMDAAGSQFPNRRLNIVNFPTQDGSVRRLEIASLVEPEHRSIRIEDNGVLVLAHDSEAENVAIKLRCSVSIVRNEEANHSRQECHRRMIRPENRCVLLAA